MDTLKDILDIIESVFMILGGLGVISRYTPWKWDDRVFKMIEKPMGFAWSAIRSIRKK